MATIKLGFAPTRRSIFSAPDAIKYRKLTADRLKELGITFVDITDVNEEGLLYDDGDMQKIAAKFKAEGIDGLFLPPLQFWHRVSLRKAGKGTGRACPIMGAVG